MKFYRSFHSVMMAAMVFGSSAYAANKTLPAKSNHKSLPHAYPSFGSVERIDPELDHLIARGTTLQKLADGFTWCEGPVWDKHQKCLFFSDVPQNIVFKWQEGIGTREYLHPSGYSGSKPRGGEPGSNGLTLDSEGRLVLCEHGDRRIARLEKDHKQTTLIEFYNWRRFNSPNDLVYKSNGDLYFTDPPYGLVGNNDDPTKELPFNGVFRLTKKGQIDLLTSTLTFPNGLAFSPDEKKLYIAQSDPKQAVIMVYDVELDGTLGKGKIFFDANSLVPGRKGLPDGMKVDQHGNLFATGPGGILILSPEGKHLGTINTGEPTGNCAWGDDGSTLYITANHTLARVHTLTKGAGFK
jgi:gluconolactonase